MAEIKKRITQLDPALGPLDGTEVSPVVQGGVTKKIAESTKYGTGWWDKLKEVFTAFKAPDADHADNADTLGDGLEDPSDFHDAAQLTGVLDLDRIPVALTGKNASTADYADKAGGFGSSAINWIRAELVGSGLDISDVDFPALAPLNGTDVAFIDGGNDQLRTYRWSGSAWSLVGSGLNITGVGYPALAPLNGTDVAFIDDSNKQLRTYRFAFSLAEPYIHTDIL